MESKKLSLLIGLLVVYVLLQFVPFAGYILYPITLIVTFLHEFGHAFFAVITGGSIQSIQISSNGAGLATTGGGIRSLVLMGGYLGSALFGNLLLYIGVKKPQIAQNTMYALGTMMILVGIVYFSSIVSSLLLFVLGSGLIFITKKFHYDDVILSFIGLASVLYILGDFRVGPSSDLAKFSDIFILIPQSVWMYIWLIIVVGITALNLKYIFKK